jgi:hypothetical protein
VQFEYAYRGQTTVDNARGDRTDMSFAPDLKRQPTFFSGELGKALEFREAISALHDVVVSDMRFKPKDKTAYKEWRARQDQIDWQSVASQRQQVAGRIKVLQDELSVLWQRQSQRTQPYYAAQRRYFEYLYEKDRDTWFVLDPVITVHDDEVFFECFSQDESSYGRLGVGYEVFKSVGELSCGTTNIDYSQALYEEFQKIRGYKTTRFAVDPAGFDVQTTGEDDYREVKIDLPDSWVRGFLQVNSAMSLPAVRFDLHPMDVHNLCFVLRRHKEQLGPRGMRYELRPGHPVTVRFEPWGIEVKCPRSIYTGKDEMDVRVWGRRRLHILERLVPLAKRFTVHLLGTGMPSFYVADLGDMSFTLGLSGWSANDWARAGNFDLLAPRAEVDEMTRKRVFDALKARWHDTVDGLAGRLQLDRATVLGALSAYTQAGRAMFDLNKGLYRARELSREPLPMEKLRFQNEREESALRFLRERGVKVDAAETDREARLTLRGSVADQGKSYRVTLTLDGDERMLQAECGCNFYQQNRLFKGPCEHMLALRMRHQGRVAGGRYE